MTGTPNAAPRAFERYRGEMIMRDQWERQRYDHDAKLREWLGRVVHDIPTRRGKRLHTGTVVAVYQGDRYARKDSSSYLWLSALSRVKWENSPRGKDHGYGTVIIRIEASTAPNMVGRYLRIGRFF